MTTTTKMTMTTTTRRSKGPCLLVLVLCMIIASQQLVVVVTAQEQDTNSISTATTSAISRRVQSTVARPTRRPIRPTRRPTAPVRAPTTIQPTLPKATTPPPTILQNSTNFPTPAPTMNNTVLPTMTPTPGPTKRPTTREPTDTPTTMAPTYPEGYWTTIQGILSVELAPVTGYLAGDTESFFLYAIQEVLLSAFVTKYPTISNLQVQLKSQERVESFARFKPAYVHVRTRRTLGEGSRRMKIRDLQQEGEDKDEEEQQQNNSTESESEPESEWLGGEKGTLIVEVNVTATERVTFLSVEEQEVEQQPLSREEFEFELSEVIRDMTVPLMETLQQGGGETNSAFFSAVVAIQIKTDAPTGTPTESPTMANATRSPTSAPVVVAFYWPSDAPNANTAINSADKPVEDADSDPFDYTLLLIIASAAGGGAVLLALAFLFCRRLSASRDEKANGMAESPVIVSSSNAVPKKLLATSTSTTTTPSTQRKPYNPINNHQPVLVKNPSYDYSNSGGSGRQGGGGDSDADADSASLAMYSYVQGGGDQGSFMGETLGGGTDAMSYAYSLEAGIEPSVADSDSLGYGLRSDNNSGMKVPMEIPQLGMIGGGGGGGRPMNGNNNNNNRSISASQMHGAGTSAYHSNNESREIELENSLIEITTSDLQLTKSELAMLPSDLMGSQTGDSLQDDQSDFDESTLAGFGGGTSSTNHNNTTNLSTNGGPMAARFVTRTCVAPSGKLGIIIDTTVEGPVVHKVNYGSALTGMVFPGDIIVAIDNVDTRAMSASAITNLMVKTAHQARTLTIISDAK